MTTRKPTDEATPETTGDAHASVPPEAGQTSTLAAAATDAIPGDTGDPIDGTITVVGDPDDLGDAFTDLKALGNANPDVNVTAVQNGHGTWTWTARAAEDGRELGRGGPNHAERLVENLQLLLSGNNTVALHATGVDKSKRLA